MELLLIGIGVALILWPTLKMCIGNIEGELRRRPHWIPKHGFERDEDERVQ